MAYARFSSDGWRSDVYVYEDDAGLFNVYVAQDRIVVPDGVWPPSIKDYDDMDKFSADMVAYMSMAHDFERKRKTEPFSGENFIFGAPGECADFLEELASVGHYIPDGVIESLREEEDESEG